MTTVCSKENYFETFELWTEGECRRKTGRYNEKCNYVGKDRRGKILSKCSNNKRHLIWTYVKMELPNWKYNKRNWKYKYIENHLPSDKEAERGRDDGLQLLVISRKVVHIRE